MTSASTDRSRSDPVHIPALGWALTITLVVLYLLCWIAALAVRELPLAHGWLLLFSTAEPGSLRSLIEGSVASVAFAWISALLLGQAYNRLRTAVGGCAIDGLSHRVKVRRIVATRD